MYLKASVFGIRNKHDKYYGKLKTSDTDLIKVLDIGCGAGNPAIKLDNNFHLVGIDLSLSLLLNAKEFYDEVYQAWAISLQFPENIFDRVCSFDLVGHIPVNQKNDVFR